MSSSIRPSGAIWERYIRDLVKCTFANDERISSGDLYTSRPTAASSREGDVEVRFDEALETYAHYLMELAFVWAGGEPHPAAHRRRLERPPSIGQGDRNLPRKHLHPPHRPARHGAV